MKVTDMFGRMFLEPGATPPRFSMARLLGFFCSLMGLTVVYNGTMTPKFSPDMLYVGMALVAFGVVLYTLTAWKKVKAGPVEIERDDKS